MMQTTAAGHRHMMVNSERSSIRTSNRRESRSRDDKHAPAYRCGHNISTNTGCRIQSILSPRKAGCHRSGEPCMVTYLPTGNNTRLKAMAALPLPLYYQAHNLNMTYSTDIRLTARRRIFHFHQPSSGCFGSLNEKPPSQHKGYAAHCCCCGPLRVIANIFCLLLRKSTFALLCCVGEILQFVRFSSFHRIHSNA